MMSGVDELARLVGWTGSGIEGFDWSRTERELGIVLPSDYKEHVALFPDGVFQGALEVIQPSSPGDVEGYLDSVSLALDSVADVPAEISTLGHDLFPELPGLFPWGRIEESYLFCWYLAGEVGESPPSFVVRVLNGSTTELEGPMAECIIDAVTGHVPQLSSVLATDEPPRFVIRPPRPDRITLADPQAYWMVGSQSLLEGTAEPLDMVDSLAAYGIPTRNAQRVDWGSVEARFGRAFPSDYKRFIEEVGPGRYGDIVVADPTGAMADVPDLAEVVSTLCARGEREFTNRPPVAPEPGGPLVWGVAPEGWYCGWLSNDLPDGRAVVCFSLGHIQSGVPRSMTNYLNWYLREGETFHTAPWSTYRIHRRRARRNG